MAVSAATVVVLIMTAMSLVTATVTTTVTAVTTAVTAAAAASLMGYQVFNLLSRGLARLKDGTLEMQRLTSQRMIQVNLHLLLANSHDMSVKTAALLVLQGNDGIFIDVFVVEMTIDAEHLTVQVKHMLLQVVTVCLLLGDGEVKSIVLG